MFPFSVFRQNASSLSAPTALAALLVTSPLEAAPLPSTPVLKRAPIAKTTAKTKVTRPVVSEYLLGPEDVLDIKVSNHPDLNASVTVRPDGRITLPRAGEITAKGKSARALALQIQNVLSHSLNNARVQVLVKQARVSQARITGAVKNSGAYPIKNGSRLLDLVGAAGGLSTKPTRVTGRIIRAKNVVPFDMSRAVAQPGSASNLALLPDDLVILDAQDFAKQITVTGSVARPGAYDLEEGLSITALLAQAGGPLPSAALRKSTVLRGGQPILTDLSDAITGDVKADSLLARFQFKPGDVVLVPENQLRFGVMGQVAKPAYYPLPEAEGEATVLKALAQAGGALPDGDLSETTITRIFNGQTKVLSVDAESMFLGKTSDNVRLKNDDVLLVPKRDKQISVSGQIARPGVYPLQSDTTLLSLLAQAGSPIKGAGLSRAYVLRGGVQIPLDLRAAVVDQKVNETVANFRLQRNDTLVIPDVSELVQVNGQVARPGQYSLDDDLTVMSLLTKAGNPTPSAALSKAYVQRGEQRIAFDLRASVAGNTDPAVAEFRFEPRDVLIVPENTLRVAVMGEVQKPGNQLYPEDAREASVLNVLNAAGGPISGPNGGNLTEAQILRTMGGRVQAIPVNINDVFKGGDLSKNVQLLPNDVLYIPAKKRKFKLTDVLPAIGVLSTLGRY